jgi:N-acetylneuraminate synthase
LGLDFKDFIKRALKFTAHLHYGDAKGINGEGLQIGSGEIDFGGLHQLLDSSYADIPFIPEIWQGHKNDGEGFWVALNKINKF